MNDVVEIIDDEPGSPIIRSEDSQIDLFFKIHEKINSKNEEISKSYKNNILVKFSDIQELHYKTIQSISSLKPVKNSIGVRIAISHNEGESERFNSFEEFEKRNMTSPNPTSDILLTYAFTLYDKETTEFEVYKINCHIRSRIAELYQIEKEAPPFIPRAILANMLTITAKISVQYSDYVKARTFTAMFDEWIKGCDESKSMKSINLLKSISHLISRFGQLTIFALLALFTSSAIDSNFISGELTVKFVVIYASVFVITGGIADIFLRKLEMSIDSHIAISHLNLNKGDAKLIDEFKDRNNSSMIWAAFGLLATVALGILTNSAYDLIKWLVIK
ncbi:hypothetical protein D3C78_598300 [compost metagenome]